MSDVLGVPAPQEATGASRKLLEQASPYLHCAVQGSAHTCQGPCETSLHCPSKKVLGVELPLVRHRLPHNCLL